MSNRRMVTTDLRACRRAALHGIGSTRRGQSPRRSSNTRPSSPQNRLLWGSNASRRKSEGCRKPSIRRCAIQRSPDRSSFAFRGSRFFCAVRFPALSNSLPCPRNDGPLLSLPCPKRMEFGLGPAPSGRWQHQESLRMSAETDLLSVDMEAANQTARLSCNRRWGFRCGTAGLVITGQ